MRLSRLKELLNGFPVKMEPDPDVVITLSQPSVGPRAYCNVHAVFKGFDWEANQIRIEPAQKLILKEKDRDIPMKMRVKEYDAVTKTIFIRSCPICEKHVKKTDNYCPKCGQRLEE